MSTNKGNIIFLTGKMASGKSTFAKAYAEEINAIVLSEDKILESLFSEEIKTIQDYVLYSNKIKDFIIDIVKTLVNKNIHVILDFPGNTIKQRAWFKNIIKETKANHQLIFLDIDDETCLKQLLKRSSELPSRNHFDTKETFYQLKTFFQEPTDDEGFNIKVYNKIPSKLSVRGSNLS